MSLCTLVEGETDVTNAIDWEVVNWENISELLKNINREKKPGALCVLNFSSSPILLGRWLSVNGEMRKCDELTSTEKSHAAAIIAELGAIGISNGIVIYENDDCPYHHTVKGTGDCNCE